jgi:sec-independent protein translocase protein TatA
MILIFLVVLLLFGAKRLPEIGSSLGKGIREFKSSMTEIQGEFKTMDEQTRQQVPPPSQPKETQDEGEPRKLSDGAA